MIRFLAVFMQFSILKLTFDGSKLRQLTLVYGFIKLKQGEKNKREILWVLLKVLPLAHLCKHLYSSCIEFSKFLKLFGTKSFQLLQNLRERKGFGDNLSCKISQMNFYTVPQQTQAKFD